MVKGRLEELSLDAKVDVLISEPMGTLLVNERMLETYIYARKRFLKPGGKMYPVSEPSVAVSWTQGHRMSKIGHEPNRYCGDSVLCCSKSGAYT